MKAQLLAVSMYSFEQPCRKNTAALCRIPSNRLLRREEAAVLGLLIVQQRRKHNSCVLFVAMNALVCQDASAGN